MENVMSSLPPPIAYAQPVAYATTPQVTVDDNHLRLLAIFHYVWGGLIALGSSIALIHVTLGIVMLANPAAFNSPGQPPAPAFMGWMFLLIGGAILLIGWTLGGITIYSGRCLKYRRGYLFSLILAGLHCLSFPLGTVLGIFTFVVLLRPSVKAEYEYRRANPT
jgi:hypothetical protein